MRNFIVTTILIGVIFASTVWCSVETDLAKAAGNNQIVFLLVTDNNAIGVDATKNVINQAVKENKNTLMIEMDRSNPANAGLVGQYRLTGAPVPLILVLTPDGMVAGGVEGLKATTMSLKSMIPTPKKAEVIGALQTGNPVFVLAGNPAMANYSDALNANREAIKQLGGKATLVEINLGNSEETAFMSSIGINTTSTVPITAVINAQGQVTGTFPGAPPATTLSKSATAVPKSGGCCPSSGAGGGC